MERFEGLELEYPTGEGEILLENALRSTCLWRKENIKLPNWTPHQQTQPDEAPQQTQPDEAPQQSPLPPQMSPAHQRTPPPPPPPPARQRTPPPQQRRKRAAAAPAAS